MHSMKFLYHKKHWLFVGNISMKNVILQIIKSNKTKIHDGTVDVEYWPIYLM